MQPPAAGRRMLAEIKEQPDRVRAALEGVRSKADALADLLADVDFVLLLGRGSSRSAATYAAEAFRTLAGKPAFGISPAQLAWGETALPLERALVIAVSQSGESTEILAAARRVVAAGGRLLVLTNSPESTLAALVDEAHLVQYHAGAEVAVPATKSFTTSLACLYGAAASGTPGLIDEALLRIPEAMEQLVADGAARLDLSGIGRFVVAGEGFAEAVAEEGAIKLRETLQCPVASFEASEFLHGSINSVGPDSAVVAIAVDDVGSQLASQILREASARGARVVHVGPGEARGEGQHMKLPNVPAPWMPLLAVVPIQLAAHDAAVAAGLDPDAPPRLTKVTRIEEIDRPLVGGSA